MNKTKSDVIDLHLEYLPYYAAFLLEHKLDDFVSQLTKNLFDADVPLLKFLLKMHEDDRLKLIKESNIKLLTALKNNIPFEYIEESKQNWVKNQLPVVSREQIIVEDITLVNYVRRRTFRELVYCYTKDTDKIILIMDEVDRFILSLDSVLFKTYIDIQQEKIANSNDALQKRERELLEAQEIARIGSYEWDLTGNKRSNYTPEVFKIFEFTETSNLDNFLNDVHPEDRLKLKGAIEKSMHDGEFEAEYRYTRNNKNKVLHSRGKVLFENGRPVKMVGTVTDVTEKATLILKLKESEELSKQAQALTNTGNWKWSMQNNSIEWSDEMYKIYGLAPQSEKITFERFLNFIHSDDRNRRVAEITEAIRTGKASDYVMKIVTADGKEKTLKGKGEVLLDKDKNATGMLGTCQDITHEHTLTTELKRKNEELVRKNKDLESFNFIASHDLQEPLRKIQIYSNRIITEGATDIPENLMQFFHKISQNSKRMQTMIEDFLLFYQSMKVDTHSETLDLNGIIQEIKGELHQIINVKNATITDELLPVINGIKVQIKQMLKHLISNALKFSKADEAPSIHISSSHDSIGGKTYIKILVKDNGIGFDQKYENKIFELFQRLHSKDEYSGSGIGLSLCKKIVEDHQGWISVKSENGMGSAFSIYLPNCNTV